MLRPELLLGLMAAMALTVSRPGLAKEASTILTAAKRAHAKRNVERYPWAQRQQAGAVRAAERYMAISDEELWRLVPGQAIMRCIHIHPLRLIRRNPGCPVCGDKVKRFGNYPYKTDMFKHPWKIQCPSCKEFFPKNDFGAYYESGIGKGGVFDPAKADRRLLFNADHPDPGDPQHRHLVDDGYGAQIEPHRDLFFIGYYAHSGVWYPLRKMAQVLSRAYAVTDDPRYAHKAAVLLDRIADVYPSLDIEPYARKYHIDNSDGGSRKGKAVGRIWETPFAADLAVAVDTIWDGLEGDQALVDFLHAQAVRWDLPNRKESIDDVKRNLLDNIVRQIPQSIMAGRMVSNEGGCQLAMAKAAIILDDPAETTRWLDWLFLDGKGYQTGHLPWLIEGKMCRDGVGSEGSPSYSLGWSTRMEPIADLLRDYPKYTKHDLYRDFPRIKQCFKAPMRMVCIGRYTPHIGDCGNCGGVGRVAVRLPHLLHGFQVFGDPFFAQAVHFVRGGKTDGIKGDIFSPEPEGLAEKVQAAVDAHGPLRVESENMAGYGLSILQSGAGDQARALWMYWGRSWGHGHTDRLNIGYFGKRANLLPDLGYPEYTGRWPKRRAWTDASISHNVVVVDDHRQRANWGGQQTLFAPGPPCQVVEVSSPSVYPQVETYRRLSALIDVSEEDSYIVDLYRVAGGKEHLFSFHAYEGPVQTPGLRLHKQPRGTYAGEDVAFAEPYDGKPSSSTGFSYLYDVERDPAPPDQWSADWRIGDRHKQWRTARNVHLRLTMLTPTHEVALAHGDPPQNKRSNPRRLRYVLARRRGEDLRSLFVSVIEPYEDEPLIRRVERLPVEPAGDENGLAAVCLRIELADGAVDYVMSSLDLAAPRQAKDGPAFAGRFAWCRTRGGEVTRAKLVGVSEFRMGHTHLRLPKAQYAGSIADFDRDPIPHNRVYTTADLPADGCLAGQWLHVQNDGERDGSYRIESVTAQAGRCAIDLGDVSFVRGYKDEKDYSKGLRYNFAVGDRFVIWNVVTLHKAD